MKKNTLITVALGLCLSLVIHLHQVPPCLATVPSAATYEAYPPFLAATVPPLVMLVMGRDHKLYYEAYNDASDLDEDGTLDITYKPDDIDYYGYFDSHKYYEYNSTSTRFEPKGLTVNASGVVDGIGKMAPSGNYWSGDFLNYVTMTRMDALRKVLYGGYRSTDTATDTVLQRVFVPQDAHSWGKEYESIERDGYDIAQYTPLSKPVGATRHILANTTLSDGGPPLMRVLQNSVLRVWEWVAIERPVAGSQGKEGTKPRRAVTDNGVGASAEYDETAAGSAGVSTDNAAIGSATYTDNFNDNSINSSLWTQVDKTNDTAATISETVGELNIRAGGHDIWDPYDEYASVFMNDVSGNFDVKVKVTAQGNTNGWAKCGIIVRNDMNQPGTAAGAGYAVMARTPSNGYSFQYDNNANGLLESHVTAGSPAAMPAWLRLKKEGTTFTGYRSTDGTTWTLHYSRVIPSATTVQDVGLFVTSHSFGNRSLCKFDDFELTRSMGTDPSLAFDDNTATAWMSIGAEPTSADPAWIQFAYYQPQRIVKYSLTTFNGSTDLDPKEWELIATNNATAAAASTVDLADWVVVDTVGDGDLPATRTTAKSFVCDSPPDEGTTYKYYRLLITASKSASTAGVAIAEIQMMKTTDAIPATAILTDYHVRVQVCVPGMLESNSKKYPDGDYKPIGLLQRHGENDGMYFGLVSGSYTKNTSGGVLRKNIGSITDEINPNTGQLTSVNGIIKSINTFRVVDFNYTSHTYGTNCGWIATRAINEGECRMWGNPIGEMMYETLRYFAGESGETSTFTYSDTNDNTPDSGTQLGLPKPAWDDPYDTYPECSKPFMLVLSDINPSFDSDILPGSFFSGQAAETIGNADEELDVEVLADAIYSDELSPGNYFIGRQAATDDGVCTEKGLDGFGDIRGLCPEEPTKQGSYYSAAVAHYGRIKDLSTVDGNQQVRTYAVGLASPLPRIEIELEGKKIALVPFAKSVGGSGWGISAAQGSFQPTNTIVDFFIQELRPTYGKFRINYEDVEQGADHDMDAIITYEYQLVDLNGNPVDNLADAKALDITLSSDYAAGGIIQHCGYIISGTTSDGTYLEVRDVDTAASSDPDYFMDTPPGIWASDITAVRMDSLPLPLNTTRRFVVDASGGTLAAKLLTNPLWYAAKWGGFEDKNHNDLPDQQSEWDKDGDGTPDTYFYVVNPLRLEEQLNKSFADIAEKAASSTAASVLATNSKGEGNLIQAYFRPQKTFLGGELKWIGYLQSLWLDPWGNLREDSDGDHKLDLTNAATSLTVNAMEADKIITFITDADGNTKIRRYLKHYRYHPQNGNANYCVLEGLPTPVTCPDLSVDADGNPNDTDVSEDIELYDISPVFETGDRLHARSADDRKIFTFIDGDGEDSDMDGAIDQSGEEEIFLSKYVGQVSNALNDDPFNSSGEIIPFDTANAALIKPLLGIRDDSAWSYLDLSSGAPSHTTRVNNLIDYIRGKDSAELTGSPNVRSRTIDGDVWKLGDIVNSTPVSISKAPDNFHLIYHDKSYQYYYDYCRNRETVIYVGANDGMLHAFTSWIYDDSIKGYTQKASTTELLGDELWAYVPQTLLPHLKWLADPDYAHTYYVDLKPRIFDAKILPDGTHYTDGDGEKNWGTIMIMGLNMGGKHINVNEDLDGVPATFETRDFYPTYVCLDITDPRNPRILWERSYPGLGMTTSYPSVAQVGRTFDSGNYKWNDDGKWVAIFGSGPNDASGSSDYNGYSDQNGKAFVVDLLTGQLLRVFDTGEANAFMNAPVSFDKNLTYNVDGIYLGSTSWNGSAWRGKVYKINTRGAGATPLTNTASWTFSTMFDAERPVTAPLSLSVDLYDNVWAYFGTGRYIGMVDKTNTDQQYFFGVKDPDFNKGLKNATLLKANLLNADLFKVYKGGKVDSTLSSRTDITDWYGLMKMMRNKEDQLAQPDIYDGWYRSLEYTGYPSERVISRASVLGGIVFFPGYTPNDDICGYGGNTNFYAIYYETGTAYKKHILPGAVTIETVGTENLEVVKYKNSIGYGAPPPSAGFHVGREEGATAYLQMSTGEVIEINVDTALPIKSGIAGWREQN